MGKARADINGARAPGRTAPSSDPGGFIRAEILNELGLSVSEAEKVLGDRRSTLSDLIDSNAALPVEMVVRIEKRSV
jgi:plasmid maintenance system antidote protein VapI